MSNFANYGVAGMNSQKGSSSVADALFNTTDANGDGSIGQDELSAFQPNLTSLLTNGGTTSDSASGQTNDTSAAAALVQQAIAKYTMFTPAGQGVATAASFLGIA
jgi:hypothetical protein